MFRFLNPLPSNLRLIEKVSYSANEGKSIEYPIIITNTKDHFEGINRDYLYIQNCFGKKGVEWQLVRKELLTDNQNFYD